MRFDDGAVFLDGFDYFLRRLIPLEHSLMLRIFRAEPFDFLNVLIKVNLFIIVVVFGCGAGDILCEERPHKFNINIIT